MTVVKTILVLLVLVLLCGAGFIYFGGFDVAADVPHSDLVFELIDIARDRGVEVRAQGIQVPKLDDPKMIAEGAHRYATMCDGCHLPPGAKSNDFLQGLYPQPPDLSKESDLDAAEQFWVIKHGLKMSAMPAWGLTHDDNAIWTLVAFVRKLPSLTPEEYKQMTAAPAPEHKENEGAK